MAATALGPPFALAQLQTAKAAHRRGRHLRRDHKNQPLLGLAVEGGASIGSAELRAGLDFRLFPGRSLPPVLHVRWLGCSVSPGDDEA